MRLEVAGCRGWVCRLNEGQSVDYHVIMSIPSSNRTHVQSTFDALEALGIDVTGISRTYGLTDPRLHQGQRVPLIMISRLLDAIGEYTGDPEYIYKAAPAVAPDKMGTLFNIAKFCQTPFDVIRMACRYSSVVSDVISMTFREQKGSIELIATPNREVDISCYQMEGILYWTITLYRAVEKMGWFNSLREPPLEAVFFNYKPRFAETRYQHYFGCPVHFECGFTGVRLNPRILSLNILGADDRMLAYFRAVAERCEVDLTADNTMKHKVQRMFLRRMASGEPDRRDIAKALSLSVRTMQRQLATEDTNYREAVEQARELVAKQELTASGLSVRDIAFMLGYADERSFRRAFRRWTGLSPQAYREEYPLN